MTARQLGVAVVLAVVLGLGGYLLFRPASGSGPASGPAPLFTSTDLQGRTVRLADARGHPVVLNFWASWCEPCRAEFPVLAKLRGDIPDVVVLGVVFQDSDENARQFVAEHGASWPGVRDPQGQIANAYGVHPKPGIPQTFLVNAAGRLVGHHLGPFAGEADVVNFVRGGGG